MLAPEVSAQRLGEAVAFAEDAHGDQRRPAGEPYVEHLLEVVEILVSGAGVRNEDLLVAAFLHDVVEDTDRTAGGGRFSSCMGAAAEQPDSVQAAARPGSAALPTVWQWNGVARVGGDGPGAGVMVCAEWWRIGLPGSGHW